MAAVGDHVLVLRAQVANVTKGGVELIQRTIDGTKLCYGVAVRCGEDVKQVKKGDIVIFDSAESREVFFDNEEKTSFSVLNEMGIYSLMDYETATEVFHLEIPHPNDYWGVVVK
ncbi:MAG: hypothetical protein V3R87_08310 [Dehalococcoidia bacterium]